MFWILFYLLIHCHWWIEIWCSCGDRKSPIFGEDKWYTVLWGNELWIPNQVFISCKPNFESITKLHWITEWKQIDWQRRACCSFILHSYAVCCIYIAPNCARNIKNIQNSNICLHVYSRRTGKWWYNKMHSYTSNICIINIIHIDNNFYFLCQLILFDVCASHERD